MKKICIAMLALMLLTGILSGATAAENVKGALEVTGPVYEMGDSVAALSKQGEIVKVRTDSPEWHTVNGLWNDGIGGLYAAATDGENDWFAYTKEIDGKNMLCLSGVSQENETVFTLPLEEFEQLNVGMSMLPLKKGIVLATRYKEQNSGMEHRLVFVGTEGVLLKEISTFTPPSTITLKSDGETDNVHVFIDYIGDPTILHKVFDNRGELLSLATAQRLYTFDIYEYIDGAWHIWDDEAEQLVPLFD